MLDFNSNIKQELLTQLQRTQTKCEQLSLNVMDQERNYNFAEIPSVATNRAKAAHAFKDIETQLAKVNSIGDLLFYCDSNLAHKQGLFYRIFRGRMNKYFTRHLTDETVKNQLLFRK